MAFGASRSAAGDVMAGEVGDEATALPLQLDVAEAARLLRQGGWEVLDVREAWETEICSLDGAIHVPMGRLPELIGEIDTNRSLIVLCHHGVRSMQVVRWLRSRGYYRTINLAGGIEAWALQVDPAMARY